MAKVFSKKTKLEKIPRSSNLLILAILSTVLIVLVVSLLIWNKSKESEQEALREQQQVQEDFKAIADRDLAKIPGANEYVKAALVGKEYIFQNDIKYFQDRQGLIGEYSNSEALDYLIEVSATLQEAEKQGWIELESSYFNNPFKDYEKRNEMWLLVSEKVTKEALDGILYEGIVVFFVNDVGTDIVREKGREYAKDLVKQKLEEVYPGVESGKVTMKETAQILESDPEIKALSLSGNPSVYFPPQTYRPGEEEQVYYSIDQYEIIENTQVGMLTEIILQETNASEVSKVSEIYWSGHYAFYKILAKNDNGITNFDSWIDKIKFNYPIDKYEN